MVGRAERNKIKEALLEAVKDKGGMYLAMLIQSSPELPDRWNFVVSAPWIDAEGTRSAVNYFSTLLKQHLGKNALSALDRISAVSSNDRVIQRTLHSNTHSLQDPEIHMRNWQIGDWFVPEGFIFVADPSPKAKSAPARNTSSVHR